MSDWASYLAGERRNAEVGREPVRALAHDR